jgi:hypothetical protein
MLAKSYRPWGDLEWVLSKLPKIKWDIIGCMSTEDRFIGAAKVLRERDQIGTALFHRITDPISKDTELINSMLDKNQAELLSIGYHANEIQAHSLLEQTNLIIESTSNFLKASGGNIILDISTFPKRFFFPIVKFILSQGVRNFIATYSTPRIYCNTDLSGNPQSWAHLPLFGPTSFPDPGIDLAIVGVGFMPFGLPKLLLGKYGSTPVKFLFPFPPGPPNYQRTWEFVRQIEQSFTFKSSDSIIRINSNNAPDAYQYILNESSMGTRRVIFAPYGPKPFSLAMCLFASEFESQVYYTQPTYYHPCYSEGLKNTFAYCVKLGDKNFYQNSQQI